MKMLLESAFLDASDEAQVFNFHEFVVLFFFILICYCRNTTLLIYLKGKLQIPSR